MRNTLDWGVSGRGMWQVERYAEQRPHCCWGTTALALCLWILGPVHSIAVNQPAWVPAHRFRDVSANPQGFIIETSTDKWALHFLLHGLLEIIPCDVEPATLYLGGSPKASSNGCTTCLRGRIIQRSFTTTPQIPSPPSVGTKPRILPVKARPFIA